MGISISTCTGAAAALLSSVSTEGTTRASSCPSQASPESLPLGWAAKPCLALQVPAGAPRAIP